MYLKLSSILKKISYNPLRVLFSVFLISQSSCILNLVTEPDEQAIKNMYGNLAHNSPCSQATSCPRRNVETRRFKISENFYIDKLEDPDPAVRTRAATEVAEYGYSSRNIISKLEYMSEKDESKWVRRAAVKSLLIISGNNSKRAISSACKDKDEWVRYSAKKAMLKLR